MALFRVVAQDPKRQADAASILEEGLSIFPEAGDLLWAKAGLLERTGDIEGAIAVYESLYTQDSSNMIVANNLASLLSSYRDDDASLERAEVISRRLRDSDVAAFQDTYGWIAHRRGNTVEAVRNLEKAAAGLPEDAMVQYHLGMAYAAAGTSDKAAEQFKKAIDLAGSDDTRDFVASAKAELAKLGGTVQPAGN
jgi:cellulose synthase operon protein C